MNSPWLQTLKVFGLIVAGIVLFVIASFLLNVAVSALGIRLGIVLDIALLFVICWAAYAYMRYREGRQEELLQVMLAAIEARMPLVPAIYAYRYERPERAKAWQIIGWVVCSVIVVLLPVWIWVRWRRFDKRIEEFAEALAQGATIAQALVRVPDVASRETRLAAAVGERTGTLLVCLRRADRERLAAAWLEVFPRIFYPFVILLIVVIIVSFLMFTIIPKYKKIFEEFGQKLPQLTQVLIDLSNRFFEWIGFVLLAFVAGLFLLSAIIASPSVRWYMPIVGRLYRWDVQGQVLRALGQLIGAQQPVRDSLTLLSKSVEMPYVVRLRLRRAAAGAERGETLADALYNAGLLSRAMMPLVQSAEKAGTLPWALGELGDHLGSRAYRVVKRISLIVAPMLVVLVGAIVGFVVVSMFLPLITLLTGLAE